MRQWNRFRVPRRPDPETPIPTAAEIDIDSLDEATRLSTATQRILEDLEAQQNVETETLQELTVTAQDSPSSSDKGKLREMTVTDHTPSSSTPSSVGFMLMSYEYLYG
ncbi:hypothetical protein Tco_0156377 [Tanacetum coccineum]